MGQGAAVLLSLRPIMGDLSHGNINIFILFLVVLALFAYHQRREFLAGLLLGLAIACKVTPALFVPYFVWKRSWSTLAGCVAGLLLSSGWCRAWSWAATITPSICTAGTSNDVPFVVEGEITSEHNNQSLPSVLIRLLTPEPSFTHFVDGHSVPDEYYNLVSLPGWLVRLLIKSCMAAFACRGVVVPDTDDAAPVGGWRRSSA